MKYFILSVVLLWSASALAEPPRAVINGPTEGMPGDFIDLDASESVGDFFEWRVEPSQFSDGRKTFRFPKCTGDKAITPQRSMECGIASRPGKYRVTLVVSNAEGIAVREWVVVVFGNPPGTPPVQPPTEPPAQPPQPPVQPPVTPPQQPLGLAGWVTEAVTRLVTTDPARSATAKKLAGSRRSMSAAATAARDVAEFARGQAALDKSYLLIIGKTTAWDPFFKELALKLSSMNLTTIPQHQAAWLEIAAGLEGVQ